MRMLSITDLFAYDGKYHKTSYGHYVSERNIKAAREKAEAQKSLSDYDRAVLYLGEEMEKSVLSKTDNW